MRWPYKPRPGRRKKRPRKVWATWPPEWLPFRQARAFVRNLSLSSCNEWKLFCRGDLRRTKGFRPEDIPATPNGVYWDKWVNWADWLGTGRTGPGKRRYRSFREARAFARSLGLANFTAWRYFSAGRMPEAGKRPIDIPSQPSRTYAEKGWAGWGDFLGTGKPRMCLGPYRPFVKARAFVRNLGLRTQIEWNDYRAGKRPDLHARPFDIPGHPHTVYADKGWAGYGDFLGTGRRLRLKGPFRPFRKARAFARSLRLNGSDAWRDFCAGRLPGQDAPPRDIPSHPQQYYAGKGWDGWADFLGTGRTRNYRGPFRAFAKARSFARALKLDSKEIWADYCCGRLPMYGERPLDVPIHPERVYAERGWDGWGDFLGTKRRRLQTSLLLPFAKARAFARSLGLRTWDDWREYSTGRLKHLGKRPRNIPSHPEEMYAGQGWAGWGDFLGRKEPGETRGRTKRTRPSRQR